MKKILSFILYSLIIGIIFAIPLELFGIFCYKVHFDICRFLSLLTFGPLLMSLKIILLFFNKNMKINDKYIVNKIIKKYKYHENKSIAIISIFMFIFSALIYFCVVSYGVSQYLIYHNIRTNQYDKVITISKILIKLYPKDCKIYSNLAYANFQKQNYNAVIDYNKQHLKCDSNFYLSYIGIARATYFMNKDNFDNQYQNILAQLDKSLEINKDSYTAYWEKQNIHFKIKDCKNGINDIENILNIIDKKGGEKYKYEKNNLIIEERLPDNWREEFLKNLSTCPNSKEKENLIKKLQ